MKIESVISHSIGILVTGSALLGLSASPALAQQAPLDVLQMSPLQQAIDIITGQNKTGPYTLAWNNLTVDMDHRVDIAVDGVELTPDGYTFDKVKGAITFTNPVKTTSVARIQYTYDPTLAHRNADYTAAPVTVPLLRAAGTNFQLTALPDSAIGGTTGTTRLVYDVDRQMSLLGGGLTSKALFSSDGSALSMGYKYGGARNGLDSSYSSTEREFALGAGKALNFSDPSQKLSLGAHLSPARDFGMGVTYTGKTTDIGGLTDTQDLLLSMNAITPDKKKQASFTVDNTDNDTPTTVEAKQNVQLKLQPAPIVTLSAQQTDDKVTSIGAAAATPVVDTVNTSIAAVVTPIAFTKVTGALQQNTTGPTKTAATAVDAQVWTGKAVEIGGGYTDRIAVNTGTTTFDTTRANVALRPLKSVTLTGAYTQNPDTNGVPADGNRQELGLTAKLGSLSFVSGYSITTLSGLQLGPDAPDPQYGQVSLTMGLRFSKFTTMTGLYKDGITYGGALNQTIDAVPRGVRQYGFGVTHSLGPLLSLSMNGNMTEDRSLVTVSQLYTAGCTLAAKF